MNDLIALESEIADVTDGIAELQDQIRSFRNVDPEITPVTLPANFDIDAANKALDTLLKKRHTLNAEYRRAVAEYEARKAADDAKFRTDLESRYKTAMRSQLAAAVEFAKRVAESESIRDEGRERFGGTIGPLPYLGPPLDGFELRSSQSFVSHWANELIAHGYITRDDPILKPLKIA